MEQTTVQGEVVAQREKGAIICMNNELDVNRGETNCSLHYRKTLSETECGSLGSMEGYR
jgi:hypothetical protein